MIKTAISASSAAETKRPNIAVVGGGVAGIVAAYLLQRLGHVSLFERNDYLGGHTNTVLIPAGPDAGSAVDTGFIVLNDQTYPGFQRFLQALQVPVRYSNMSFGFFCEESGLCYAGTGLNGLFAQRRNLLSWDFIKLLGEIARFSRRARRDLENGAAAGLSLADYLQRHRFSASLSYHYLLPIGAAIWSTPTADMLDFPAETLLRFFKNHGLLSFRQRPRWQTVVGGSHSYVKAFQTAFSGEVLLQTRLRTIERTETGVSLYGRDGSRRDFDLLVLACHADESLALLAEPSAAERRLLGVWRYQLNPTQLHSDSSLLPPLKRAWASWNYRRSAAEKGVYVSYHMNRLQGLETQRDYLVTLNSRRPIAPKHLIKSIDYYHPLFDFAAVAGQKELPSLNGRQHTWFCGSYFGYGFHEDAVQSALAVGQSLGITL